MSAVPTVLIVDDTPINITLLQAILKKDGLRVLTATDGPSAREVLSHESADLILMDVMMPGESGFETCARLKADSSTADIPVIFLSALSDASDKVLGLKSGGIDYVTKPLNSEEVLARVHNHLELRAKSRQLAEQDREHRKQLREAQRAILVRPEDCPEAAFAVHYRPFEETGGDFYDVLQIETNVFGYFVADISGHGVSAAFLTSAIKALLRQNARPWHSPEETMRSLGSAMGEMLHEEQFVTACYARLDRGRRRLTVVSAGHPPLIFTGANGQAQVVEIDSDPLGIFSSAVVHRRELPVFLHDRFFLYSDGFIETSAGGARCEGIRRLTEACLRSRGQTLAEAVEAITCEIRPEVERPQDDLVLLAAEVIE